MKFKCPSCNMSLQAESDAAGKIVRCPGCNTKMQIPATLGAAETPAPDLDRGLPQGAAKGAGSEYDRQKPERHGWKETDPTNPNILMSLGIGFVLFLMWVGILYPFVPPDSLPVANYSGMQFLSNLFYKHMLVSFTNTFFFTWSMAIIYLKWQKLRHQKEALLLDVLPMELGREINSQNVGYFIDHVYNLPVRLRDSLMVNRIRKALELFEARQSTDEVRGMMGSQSDIDSARIGGSFTLLRAFLWAIPILGFIGTVLGLSHAIGGMNFGNVDDVKAVMASINKVTSGLGTAFDATLLGLVLAMTLNFPMNSLVKQEDDNLNDIDAFCNEILLPRLNDGSGAGGGDVNAIADSVLKGLASAQSEFLKDLNELSKRMNDYANNLDKRSDAFQSTVTKEFTANVTAMRTDVGGALKESMRLTSQYIGALETGIRGLNTTLKELGEKQIVIQQVKKKSWFSRD